MRHHFRLPPSVPRRQQRGGVSADKWLQRLGSPRHQARPSPQRRIFIMPCLKVFGVFIAEALVEFVIRPSLRVVYRNAGKNPPRVSDMRRCDSFKLPTGHRCTHVIIIVIPHRHRHPHLPHRHRHHHSSSSSSSSSFLIIPLPHRRRNVCLCCCYSRPSLRSISVFVRD